jgi:hypothetical protein
VGNVSGKPGNGAAGEKHGCFSIFYTETLRAVGAAKRRLRSRLIAYVCRHASFCANQAEGAARGIHGRLTDSMWRLASSRL